MPAIRYICGDATCPQAKGTKLIAHVCPQPIVCAELLRHFHRQPRLKSPFYVN